MGKWKWKKRLPGYFKKAAVAMLVLAMVIQPIPGVGGSLARSAEAAVMTGDYIDLKNTETELYVGTDWSGAAATVAEDASTATVTAASFGYNGEWGLQYMVKDLALASGTEYLVEFDITSTVDKNVLIKLDDTGLIVETLSLAAGTTHHYIALSVAGTPTNSTLYFALGQMSGEEANRSGTVTIEDVRVTAVSAGDYVDLENTETELYAGTDWSGAAATVTEAASTATVTAASFGYNGEWGLQYMVKALALASGTEYLVEFDITSTVDKNVLIKLDDTGLIVETLSLAAGTTHHYIALSVAGTPTNSTLYFALGQMSGEEANRSGTITIENVRVAALGDTAAAAAVPITVNRTGTKVTFQVAEADVATGSAITYYAVCDSETEADMLPVGDTAFNPRLMTQKANGIWEATDDTIALTNGQIIRYYFGDSEGNTITTPENHLFTLPADYTHDNRADLLADGYTMVWNDEFNGGSLDSSKWSFQIGTEDASGNGPDYWGNEEKEYYTDSNHEVKDGELTITAKQESMGGMPYTSTRMRTVTDDGDTLFATKYGRVEARMKLPTEEGLWPAFWMLPVDPSIYGTWAASGELDILEARGRIPDTVGGTIHYGSQWPNNTYYGKEYTFDSTTDIGAYHLYSVEWEPGKITWFVDDVEYFSTGNFWSKDSGNAENYTYGAPFDVPFYLVLNLAVGGTFDSAADLSKATFPASMSVDYVRVYQKSADYYQNLEDNLVEPEPVKDTASFESGAYQPAGTDGDYVADTAFNSLRAVDPVDPASSDWQFFVGDFGGAATVSKDTIEGITYAKTSITAGGNQNYAVQLIKHFPFANGYTYEVGFDAKASANREFLLKPCGDGDNGWTGYGVSKTVSLTTDMTHYTHRFTMDKDSDPTARLEFDLGLAIGDVWIGNVVVKQVEPEVADTTDDFKDPDKSSGNHIWNGSFDQGTARLGFWHTENVSVTVPGVIHPVHDVNTGDSGDYTRRAVVAAAGRGARIYQNGIWLQQSDIYKLTLNLSSEAAAKVTATLKSKDGSKVYRKQILAVPGTGIGTDYTVYFAMPRGVTDTEGVFELTFENGSTVSVDNIKLVRTTNNNVDIDYSGVDLEPVKTDSTGWTNNLNNGGSVTPADNVDGVITSQTVNHQMLSYMSMLYLPVSVKAGITYHLSFQAKSEYANSVELSIQEDNTWAETMHETLDMTAGEWQEFNYTFNSTLTNGSNPIFLKFLLSGPDVTPGEFYVKNVSMTAEVQEGSQDAPEGTVATTAAPVRGSAYVIALKDGDYKTKFLQSVAKLDEKSLVTVNGAAFAMDALKALVSQAAGTITIPAASIGTGTYRIELSQDGFNNIVLSGTVQAAVNPGGSTGNDTGSNTGDDKEEVTDAAAPVIVTQPAGGKYEYKAAAAGLTVSATGDGALTYQWYKNSANTTSGASAVSGTTGASYTPSTAKVGTTYYYCVVTNTNEKATGIKSATAATGIAAVEVTKAANKITGVKDVSKAYGSKAFTLKAKAKGTITYKSSNSKVVTVGLKNGKVTVKGIGKATITVTASGDDNYKASTKKVIVTVTPKKATVTGLKSGKAKSLTVAWKKDTKATGYQIQYSTSSKFSSAKTATISKNTTTTKTVSKLSGGKTYYVRVRAYTKSGTNNLYGSWSTVKKAVVKK